MKHTLEELKQHLIQNKYGTMEKGLYPVPYMARYVGIKYPEIAKEFAKWFDKEVRGRE